MPKAYNDEDVRVGEDVAEEEVRVLVRSTDAVPQFGDHLVPGLLRGVPAFPAGEVEGIDLPVERGEHMGLRAGGVVAAELDLEAVVRGRQRLHGRLGVGLEG